MIYIYEVSCYVNFSIKLKGKKYSKGKHPENFFTSVKPAHEKRKFYHLTGVRQEQWSGLYFYFASRNHFRNLVILMLPPSDKSLLLQRDKTGL